MEGSEALYYFSETAYYVGGFLLYLINGWFLYRFYGITKKKKMLVFFAATRVLFGFCLEIFHIESLIIPDLFFLFLFSYFMNRNISLSITGSLLVTILLITVENMKVFFLTHIYNLFGFSLLEHLLVVAFFYIPLPLLYLLYRFILKFWMPLKEKNHGRLLFLWVPITTLLLSQTIILETEMKYEEFHEQGVFSVFDTRQIIFIALITLFSILAVLKSYQLLSQYIDKEKEEALLHQKIIYQKKYIQEVQSRYNMTKAFRHDLNNHMIVLDGLLKEGNNEAAEKYLKKLKETAETFTHHIHTGSAVLDILLSEKFALAKVQGIEIDSDIQVPEQFPVDEMDLNILFANAMDNAISACQNVSGKKYIQITAKRNKDFFVIHMKNSAGAISRKGSGQGIPNMQSIAEKYHGAVNIQKDEISFTLGILLMLSQQ